MIRVFLVDDHSIVREGLNAVLEGTPDIRCVGTSESKAEALELLPQTPCDIVLLDHSLPDGSGAELMRTLRNQRHPPHIVFYTMLTDKAHALRLLKAGAAAFLCKTTPTEELLLAIRQVARHGRYLTADQQADLLQAPEEQSPAHTLLSERESEIFLQLVRGRTPSEVSVHLNLAPSTVSTHLRRIKNKLQLETIADMVHYAYRHKLIDSNLP